MEHRSGELMPLPCLVYEDCANARFQDAIVAAATDLASVDQIYNLLILIDHRIGVQGLQTARQEELLHFHCMQNCIRANDSF
jgi:hypothetical protein